MATTGQDFAQLLISRGIVGPDQLDEAVALQQDSGVKLEDALVRLGYATQAEVVRALAEHHNVEFVDLDEVQIPPAIVDLVPESVARENNVMPLAQENGRLKVIMSDPMDLETLDKLRFILNRDIEVALAPQETILVAINRHYGQSETESVDSMLSEFTNTAIDFTDTEVGPTSDEGAFVDDSDAPIVKLVHLIFQEAVSMRASDIHIEPFDDRIRVRYRIDGVCIERNTAPRRLHGALVSRIKIMGKIDIAEKRRPQDGRIKMRVGGRDLDVRVSVLPTNHGQTVVMRLLDKESIKVGIRQLGFGDEDYKRFQSIIRRPNGIFLVTGPTGSGKTTSLYAALNDLNRPDRKILTAEDPVEYYLPGVNQVEVKHGIGLDFARIIRAMLRQAPNVILVGEIRDRETAEMAIQASLTGHLVFSTLHTNDAPGAITRLIDIGVQPFLVSCSVMAVMAQRLVRVICPKCKEPEEPDANQLQLAGLTPDQLQNAQFMRGTGCSYCQQSGYYGRIGIFELMQMNSAIRDMTFRMEPTQNLRRQARLSGMKTLLEDAVEKALTGVTTLEEALRVTQQDTAKS